MRSKKVEVKGQRVKGRWSRVEGLKVSLATQHADAAFTPLALLYLKAYLVERLGIPQEDVVVLEFSQDQTTGEIARAVVEVGADIVGFSCYVWNVRALTAVCARVKELRPSTRIVLGGPEVGPVAASTLRTHRAVDVIVRSEGEGPFAEIVSRWASGRGVDEIAGISFRDGESIRETADAPILTDLNALPSPHLTLRGALSATSDCTRDLGGRVACIETQRGCVFRCTFCFYNKDLSIRNRRFDLDRVKDELTHLLALDADEIYLMDPIFNLYADRAKEICRFIAAHNEKRIGIHAEIWAEFMDDELAGLMREANVQFLEIGLQSTDDTALQTVERRLKLQRFLDGVECVKRHGLKWELQLIYGLPGETRASFRRSLNFAISLDPYQLAVYPLMVLPGTELWRKAADVKLTFDPDPPYIVRSHFSMNADDIAYGHRVVRALQDLGDFRTLRLLARERGITYADVIDAWIAWDGEQPGPESTGYRVKQFLLEFCARNEINADFYRGLASLEFAG